MRCTFDPGISTLGGVYRSEWVPGHQVEGRAEVTLESERPGQASCTCHLGAVSP